MKKFRIAVKPRYYMGYLQGYKVIVNGIKFPLQHGFWYTTMNRDFAITAAISDYKSEIENAA